MRTTVDSARNPIAAQASAQRKSLGPLISLIAVRLEYLFVILALTFFAGGFFIFANVQQDVNVNVHEGNRALRTVLAGIYVVTALLMVIHRRKLLRTWRKGMTWIFLLPVILALVSVFWSFDVGITVRRNVALIGTTLFGVYLGGRFSRQQQLSILRQAFFLMGLLSIATVLLAPGYGSDLEHGVRGWRGIFIQKNVFGRAMAFGFIIALITSSETNRRLYSRRGLVAYFGLLLLLSRSTGALVALLCLVPALVYYSSSRFNRSSATLVRVTTVVSTLLLVLAGALLVNPLLGLMNKDINLTGRVPLWTGIWHATEGHRWFGYGYGAFWLGWDGPSALVWDHLYYTTFRPLHAHSAYMEQLGQLGYVGLALAFVLPLLALRRAHLLAIQSRAAERLWPPLFLIFLLCYNVIESLFLGQNSITWILYVAIAMWLTPKRRLAPMRANIMTQRENYIHEG